MSKTNSPNPVKQEKERVEALKNIDMKEVKLADIIISSTNPRKEFEESAMNELIDSIREKGVLQPVLLRPNGKPGKYELVCGERRYRASMAVMGAYKYRDTVPSVIRNLTDEEALELQIIENIQRRDIHPMEEAVGFKHLIETKKISISDIAKRVGKTPSYIALRLKLNELSSEWQKAFYEKRITLSDAVNIARISPSDQQALWKDNKVNTNIEINDWELKRYMNNLNNAPFDINDAELDKKMGVCTGCQFNSAVNSLLFPDQANKAICTNSQCFRHKAATAFDRNLQKAIDSPEVVIVSSSSWPDEKLIKQFKERGVDLLADSQYEEIDAPEDDYLDVDRDDYESDKEYNEAIADEEKTYKEAQEKYQKKIKAGKYTPAFMVDGNDKGKTIFIELSKKKASAAAKSKVDSGDASASDIKSEIARIQDREKQAKELDGKKVHFAIVEELEKHNAIKKPGLALTKLERALMIFLIYEHLDYSSITTVKRTLKLKDKAYNNSSGLQRNFFEPFAKMNDKDFAYLLRQVLIAKYSTQMPHYAGGTSLRLLAEALGDLPIKKLEKEQDEKAKVRSEKVNKRIADLRALLKESAVPAKKGKGVKALLTDAE